MGEGHLLWPLKEGLGMKMYMEGKEWDAGR